MTASLDLFKDLPSIAKIMSELDGIKPGVSLYDIVSKRCKWESHPSSAYSLDGRDFLRFNGGSGNLIHATYRAAIKIEMESEVLGEPEPPRRRLPLEDRLEVSWHETKTQRFHLICESSSIFGITMVKAYVRRGENSFPIWGDPHPYEIGQNYEALKTRGLWGSWWDDKESSVAKKQLQRVDRCDAFLAARMHLAMGIDWVFGGIRDLPKTTTEIGGLIARVASGDGHW